MANILDILNGFNIAVHASTSWEKILPFQTIFRVKIEAIVFVILPIIVLIAN